MVFWAREKIRTEFEQARQEARRQGKAEGKAEGRAEGRVEIDQEWRAWYERMQAAQREGRAFSEPPPDLRDGEKN